MGIIKDRPIEERVAYWESELFSLIALGNHDVLRWNSLAAHAGQAFCEAKVAYAEAETKRKQTKRDVIVALVSNGLNKTTAKEQVEDTVEYLDAARAAEVASEVRDKIEVVYRIAFQRAWLLWPASNALPLSEGENVERPEPVSA